MAGSGENEEKKKYSVVDKRFDSDEEPASGSSGESAPEPAEKVAPEPDVAQEDSGEVDEAAGEKSEEGKSALRMADALRAVMGMLRERALLSMGLIISAKRPKTPDIEQARVIAELFGKLADSFAGRLGMDELGEAGSQIPSLEQTLEFCFNIIQGQVYSGLGLIPDPATGLVVRDFEQARLGIDFISSLIEHAGPLLGPEAKRDMEAHLSNMRIQFVTVLKNPS